MAYMAPAFGQVLDSDASVIRPQPTANRKMEAPTRHRTGLLAPRHLLLKASCRSQQLNALQSKPDFYFYLKSENAIQNWERGEQNTSECRARLRCETEENVRRTSYLAFRFSPSRQEAAG